jgi:hypothetical protein
MEICDKAVMDFLAATDVGKSHRGEAWRSERPVFYITLHTFLLSAGTKGSRWELLHLTGSPGGRGDKGLSYSS